jgi:hypothetical protein
MTERRYPDQGSPDEGPEELVDAGPALRISEERPAGMQDLVGYVPMQPVIEGPAEPPSAADQRRHVREGRGDLYRAALLFTGLLLVAGLFFVRDGLRRADTAVVLGGVGMVIVGVVVFVLARRVIPPEWE